MQADLCNLEDAGPCSGEYWAILLLSFEESLSPPTDPINLKFSPRTNEPTYPRATTRHDVPWRAPAFGSPRPSRRPFFEDGGIVRREGERKEARGSSAN